MGKIWAGFLPTTCHPACLTTLPPLGGLPAFTSLTLWLCHTFGRDKDRT